MENAPARDDRVLVEVTDGLARVTLNRPDKLNAIDIETYRILDALADEFRERDEVRAVVLTGNGRAFSAGADLTAFAGEMNFDDPHMLRDRVRFVGSVVSKWVQLDKPTIAAVNGLTIGGDANLALMCDLLLMREDATIAQSYVRSGLVMDMGGTYFLPRLVGRALANELALFGEPVTAADAVRIGLANRCVPIAEWDATVADWGARLANGASRAQRIIKTGLVMSPSMDLDAILEWEASMIALVFQTDDVRESFTAFQEKRAPVFNQKR
jgi:2-(1,2-epoxy-1,2-dihydrophenyl)acetyl-CoA isomerase